MYLCCWVIFHLLKWIYTFKYLGIPLSDNLWSPHVHAICSKARQILGLPYRNFSNSDTLIHIYISLIRPHFDNACPVWSPYLAKDIQALERVQAFTCKMWPSMWKPNIWDLHAISAKRVFSTWGQYLSNFSFCHVHIHKPLLPSLTKAKCKLLRQNKPFLTSVSMYLVSAAAHARSPLLWALIRIRSSWLFRSGYIHLSTEQRRTFCASYPARKKVAMAKVDPSSIFAFTSGISAFIEITSL